MSTACLNGLTATYRQQVVATNTVDFTKLQPQDVERLVPTNQLDIDWSAVIFIKNCRRRKAIADTVVWTEQGGFYRTRQSPRALINQVVETSLVQWLDMRAMVDYLELSGPLPYVMGRIMLVSTERPADGNQTSWVGCWSVSHMNPTTRQHQVSLLLTNGMTMIIRDTVSRLRKKIAEAHQDFPFQAHVILTKYNVINTCISEATDAEGELRAPRNLLLHSENLLLFLSDLQGQRAQAAGNINILY